MWLIAHSGCGPLGLLTLAVAKAYGVRKVIMFDIEKSRVDFAVQYGADSGIVPPANELSKEPLAFAQEYTKDLLKQLDLDAGFDVAVEATGAEACAQMALCILKSGGTCTLRAQVSGRSLGLTFSRHSSRAGKAIDVRPFIPIDRQGTKYKRQDSNCAHKFGQTSNELLGTVRYTPGCFEDAIDLLSRKKVDLKPLITSRYPLTECAEAFRAQQARKDIKIVIMNQD